MPEIKITCVLTRFLSIVGKIFFEQSVNMIYQCYNYHRQKK